METEKRKKGLVATIWESMTKTGGCCGPGEGCCGPSNKAGNKSTEEHPRKNQTADKKNE